MLDNHESRILSAVQRMLTTLAFARHIPPRQICRRLIISVSRKITFNRKMVTALPIGGVDPISRKDWTLLVLQAPHGKLNFSNGQWSGTFLNTTKNLGANIDWENVQDTQNSQLWRMNLHYFEFLPEMDSQTGFDLILDWIKNCRPKDHIALRAAWNSYTISLRISAWLNFYSQYVDEATPYFLQAFTASLCEQAAFLTKNMETDILGNHIIKNIRALTEVTYAFSHDSRTTTWEKTADRWLTRQLEQQILEDGTHFELSPSYHSQIFADLLCIYAVREHDHLNLLLGRKLDAMAQHLSDLCHPDGSVAQFNDSGLDMTVSPADCLAAYSKLRGKDVNPQTVFAYPDGGFFGFRTSELYVIIKMGKLGPDSLMAHAHADWGSFETSVHGKRTIVDQGVYEYVQGNKRDLSRSTLNHNTAVFSGKEQALFIGAFRCAYRPRPGIPEFKIENGGFHLCGTLSGIHGLRGTTIKRSFTVTDNVIHIEDSSSDPLPVSASLLFHPDCLVKKIADETKIFCNKSTLEVCSIDSNTADVDCETAFWWPNMGVEMDTTRLRFKSNSDRIQVTISHSQ